MTVEPTRRELAAELLGLSSQLARADELKAALRKHAEAGKFKEVFPGQGTVTVSAGSKPTFKGLMPELSPVLFLASDQDVQDHLTKVGLVVLTEQWSSGSSPSVTVKAAS